MGVNCVPREPFRLCICWRIPARCYGNLCRPGGAGVLGCREGDSEWGQGESAASLVGPGVRARLLGTWRLSGPRAAGGLGTRGLRAPRHPQKGGWPWSAAGGRWERSAAQQERVGGGARPVFSLSSKGRRVGREGSRSAARGLAPPPPPPGSTWTSFFGIDSSLPQRCFLAPQVGEKACPVCSPLRQHYRVCR